MKQWIDFTPRAKPFLIEVVKSRNATKIVVK